MNLETLKIGTTLNMVNRDHPNGYQDFTYLGRTLKGGEECYVVKRGVYLNFYTKEDFVDTFEVFFESDQDIVDVIQAEMNMLSKMRDDLLTGKFY